MSRAVWKGQLLLGDHELPVKMYSAVEDRKVHFRLLHAADLAPVQQRIVRKSDGKEVPREERRKAYPLDDGTAVILQAGELEGIEPEAAREIQLCRFVPNGAISDQWFDRPYYLGPDDEDDAAYFALSQAMAKRKVTGVARWAMRRKRYVGALSVVDGYLMMITLRRADQVLSVVDFETSASRRPDEKEIRLAEQLVSSIAADFEPGLWENEYQNRVRALIAAKARGQKVKVAKLEPKRTGGDLAERLRQSIAASRERKVA